MTALDTKRLEIAAACQENDVKRLELFGSRARADFRADSDIDFLVEFNDPLRAGIFDRFLALRDALQCILGCQIDLVERSAIENAILKRRIEADRTVVYAA